MKIKTALCFLTIVMTLLAVVNPASAGTAAVITGAGGALFGSGASWNGVALSSARFGIGVDTPGDGTAAGDFETTLTGKNALGAPVTITVTGKATAASVTSASNASFSGSCSVDPGDGTPLLTLPVTVLVAPGTLAITLGATSIPAATVNAGGIRIQ